MWVHIDLPRARCFGRSEAEGTEPPLRFDGYDYRIESLGGDPPPRFRLTVRLRAPEDAAPPPQMCWSERYDDEQAARCAVARIIGAMPEA